jgi:hypothetical protein
MTTATIARARSRHLPENHLFAGTKLAPPCETPMKIKGIQPDADTQSAGLGANRGAKLSRTKAIYRQLPLVAVTVSPLI